MTYLHWDAGWNGGGFVFIRVTPAARKPFLASRSLEVYGRLLAIRVTGLRCGRL